MNKKVVKRITFDEYQKRSRKTARYPTIGKKFIYPTIGLAGESGEVLEKIKKIFRDKNARVTKTAREELAKEIGDVLWYLTQLSTDLGLSLSEVAEKNLEKLNSRLKRGKIKGNGDNR